MKLINNNCIDAMKEMPENSVDSIVTDPPYELGFMGKAWDSTGVAFNVEVWKEALRVLKPGGHLIAFSGSRTYHRMAVAIEDAGFEIRDQIMWIYGSGFPKSMDISKAIDKSDAAEARMQRNLTFTRWMRSTSLSRQRATDLLQSAGVISENGTMAGHFYAETAAGQPSVATAELFDVLRPHLPEVPDYIEEMVRQRTIESENFKKRAVLGVQKNAMAGWSMDGETQFVDRNITAPATAEAKQWQGWGTALKPAHEPMVLARKPIVGTVANNVLTYGVGGLNIDGSRVGSGTGEEKVVNYPDIRGNNYNNANGVVEYTVKDQGRWPANFIHDGSWEVVELFPDSKSTSGMKQPNNTNNEVYSGTWNAQPNKIGGFDDSGSAARFFYCAKTSKRDRNEGLDGFEKKQVFGDDGGTYQGLSNSKKPDTNFHPTVKPTDLMRYLCKLVTPPGGTVLDPFMGSGSTGKGAVIEGFDFIGIEMNAEYLEIAKARIAYVQQ